MAGQRKRTVYVGLQIDHLVGRVVSFGVVFGMMLLFFASPGKSQDAGLETSDVEKARAAWPCHKTQPCPLKPTHYIALPPKNWDGTSAMRFAVWFHGWGRSAAVVARNKKLIETFHKHNVLVIAPSGFRKGWAVPGTPQDGRDDIVFVEQLLDDVARRFPIAKGSGAAFGFSLGGSFVWTLACQRPDLFQHHVAFAGGFWRPHPKTCAKGPVNLVHIHGEKDGVVPLEGRPIGAKWYQGDVPQGLKFWRTSKQCGELSDRFAASRGLTCRIAQPCQGTRAAAITSCRHARGHIVQPEWVDWVINRLWNEVP